MDRIPKSGRRDAGGGGKTQGPPAHARRRCKPAEPAREAEERADRCRLRLGPCRPCLILQLLLLLISLVLCCQPARRTHPATAARRRGTAPPGRLIAARSSKLTPPQPWLPTIAHTLPARARRRQRQLRATIGCACGGRVPASAEQALAWRAISPAQQQHAPPPPPHTHTRVRAPYARLFLILGCSCRPCCTPQPHPKDRFFVLLLLQASFNRSRQQCYDNQGRCA